jgi:hypothetical protein
LFVEDVTTRKKNRLFADIQIFSAYWASRRLEFAIISFFAVLLGDLDDWQFFYYLSVCRLLLLLLGSLEAHFLNMAK